MVCPLPRANMGGRMTHLTTFQERRSKWSVALLGDLATTCRCGGWICFVTICWDLFIVIDISLTFPLFFRNYRQREPPRSERDTTRHTLLAVDVERSRITSRRALALLVDTLLPRLETTLTWRLRDDAPLELVACVTWRPWHADSRMVSEREHRLRNRNKQ